MAVEDKGVHDLEEQIRDVLRTSDQPMKSLDIAKKLNYSNKQQVNKAIYAMKERGLVVRSGETNPPLWQLASGTPAEDRQESVSEQSAKPSPLASSTAFSRTDKQLQQEILMTLERSSIPLHAPDIARKLSSGADNKAVKRVLYSLQEAGQVENKAPTGSTKPLWALNIGGKCSAGPQVTAGAGSEQARFHGQPLYTREDREDGIVFKEVKQEAVMKAGLGTTEPALTSSSQTQPQQAALPQNMVGGDEDVKHKPPETASSSSSFPSTASAPARSTSRGSRQVNIAATFGNLAISLSEIKKELVRKFLQDHTDTYFTSSQVKKEVGADTRDVVMEYLEELVAEGKVCKQDGQFAEYRWTGN